MITKEQATQLKCGTILEHTTKRNRDNTPIRARVNGMCKVWKRTPGKFQLPMKYGLKTCFHITEENANEWRLQGEE